MTFAKVGPHCQTHSDPAKLWASVAPIVLQMDATDYLSAVGAGVTTVFRKYFPSADPIAAGMSASTIYQQIMSELGGFRPSYVQLLNENNQSQSNNLAAWADIVAQIVPMFHGVGIKVAGFCFSTGNPFQTDVDYLVTRAWCGVDAIIMHEYWGSEGFTSDNALRHRLLHQWANGSHPPIILGECGRANIEPVGGAGSGDVGWQDWGISATEYANELHQYDALISQDAYVLGATVFTAAPSSQWASFSTDGILDAMGITAPGTGGTGGGGGGTGGGGGGGGTGGTGTATPWWGSLPWYFWVGAAAAIGVAAIGVSSAMAEGEARATEAPQIAYEHDANKPIPAGYHQVE